MHNSRSFTRTSSLVLQQPQATLHNHVLEDRAWWDVDRLALSGNDNDGTFELHATTEIDGTSDGEVVELDHLRDRWDAGLEGGDLLEVVAKLDQWCWAEAVGVDHELAVLDSVKI